MRIAIVGSGIAGLYAAHRLGKGHEVTVFESSDHIGGNVRTFPVPSNGECYEIDVGASLFNPKTYPAFFRLLEELAIRTRRADLSCVVNDGGSDFTWRGSFQRVVFGSPLSFLSPSMLWLAKDAWRFYRDARQLLRDGGDYDVSLAEFLGDRYHGRFVTRALAPLVMVAWGAEPRQVGNLSARCVAEYLLRIRPGWQIIRGGTQRYLRALTESFRDRIRLRTPVRSVRRRRDHAEVCTDGGCERFDIAVIATPGDQALELLEAPTEPERQVLGAFTFQTIKAVLHRDPRVMGLAARRPFPSVCIRVDGQRQTNGFAPPSRLDIAFHLNRMMATDYPDPLFASVEPTRGIAEGKVLGKLEYRQPLFTPAAISAQRQWDRINGCRRTFYCGAYWGFGEHEDAINSASAVFRRIERREIIDGAGMGSVSV